MNKKLFVIGLTGSGVAFFDLGYGFAIIVIGILFVTFLEFWRYKNKHNGRS